MNKIGSSTGPAHPTGITPLRGETGPGRTNERPAVVADQSAPAANVSFSPEAEAVAALQGSQTDEHQLRPEVVEQLRARLDSGELSRVDDALVEAVADAIAGPGGEDS